MALMKRLPKLKIISCFGVGVDGIDVAAARELGIAVTNTPDVLTECVADNAWSLVLSTMRRTVFNDRFVRAGTGSRAGRRLPTRCPAAASEIIGLGRIGKAIARRAEAFGMKIVYHGRQRQADVAYDYFASPVDMAKNIDVLVLSCPGGKDTEKIVSKEVLDALGPKRYLVNVSRGSTVDEPALVDALVNGRLAARGSTCSSPSRKCPRRCSSSTTSSCSRMFPAARTGPARRWGNWWWTTWRRFSQRNRW